MSPSPRTWTVVAAALLASIEAIAGPSWDDAVARASSMPEHLKALHINRYINSAIAYQDDILTWHTNDYWATPAESLAAGKGDCEDFAIAKYASLLRAGVSASQLRLLYTPSSGQRPAHMVLAYYSPTLGAALVLDNATDKIDRLEDRQDLAKHYSIGVDGIRLATGVEDHETWRRLQRNLDQAVARATADGSLGEPDATLAGKAASREEQREP